jgi:hypothetical protein
VGHGRWSTFYHLFYTIDISILNCERERDFAQIDKKT